MSRPLQPRNYNSTTLDLQIRSGSGSRAALRSASITASLLQMPVSVVDLPGRGRSLIATRYIERGELIFTEAPLVSVQDMENRAKTISCAACHAFVGSLVRLSYRVRSPFRFAFLSA